MNWDFATDIILYAAILLLAVFAALGLYQWLSRKSLKKVDSALKLMLVPLSLVVITYLIFDHLFILGTAPNDPTKPSFPSTHAMVVTTIFALLALASPRYIKSKPLRCFLDLLMLALLAVTALGRVLSENHSTIDVACGIIFGIIFATIYFILTKTKEKK